MQKKVTTSKFKTEKGLVGLATDFPDIRQVDLARQFGDDESFDIEGISNQRSNYDIMYQMPKYFREKNESNSNDLFINFIQSYYDWLYLKNGGSGYPLDYEDFNKIMSGDSDNFNEIKHFVFSYLSGFPEEKLNSNFIDVQNLKEFITSIRSQFYQYKGNEQSFVYFFNTLYGSTLEDIQVNEPKKRIMRLNGGRFADWSAVLGSTGSYEELSSLGGSYLNNSVLRDGYFYQDYAYSVKTGQDPREYASVLNEILHPAGLLSFLETSITDYIPGETEDDPGSEQETVESPVLYNYFAYNMGSSGDIEPCAGCDNSSYNTEIHPPDGTTADEPTFNHPGWALCSEQTISDGKIYYDCDFSSINIGDFFYLSGINPNENIPPCQELECPRVTQ